MKSRQYPKTIRHTASTLNHPQIQSEVTNPKSMRIKLAGENLAKAYAGLNAVNARQIWVRQEKSDTTHQPSRSLER